MTASLADIERLPNWPALLSREQAAAYMGMSPPTFDLCVSTGRFPSPVDLPVKRLLWYRQALDTAIQGKGDERAQWETPYKNRPARSR
jgi:predicted DNA-binding transcriptional regulator AlpA